MNLAERYDENAVKLGEYIEKRGITKELGDLLIEHLEMVNEIIGKLTGDNDVLSCSK